MVHQPGLKLIEIRKSFGDTQAVAGISFDVEEGEIVALLGPSGSGKSTVLLIISGLEKPDNGIVMWKAESILQTPPHLRGFGLMFQDFVLFPHMNVFDNISFGLRMSGLDKNQVKNRVGEMLEMIGLPGLARRDVHTLSGGEQQRVALARALAPAPRLLMLDEPLGSVDRALREKLMVEVRHILHQMNQTALYVTHDQEEAFAIADRVVVMREGKIEQIGTPQEIYLQPTSLFIAHFLGFKNLLPAEILNIDGQQIMRTPIGNLPINQKKHGKMTVLLRPDAVYLDRRGEKKLHGIVLESSFRGNMSRTIISVEGTNLQFDFPSRADLPKEGENVVFSFNVHEAIQVFIDDENE